MKKIKNRNKILSIVATLLSAILTLPELTATLISGDVSKLSWLILLSIFGIFMQLVVTILLGLAIAIKPKILNAVALAFEIPTGAICIYSALATATKVYLSIIIGILTVALVVIICIIINRKIHVNKKHLAMMTIDDKYNLLFKLKCLKDSGAMTSEEYEKEKEKLLSK